ncbi:unnamed protein product [Nippostrongylus brasiliensis]|uniref:Phlebovirus_G2 domain-containing protein n=1 Tax=Nippostrongylus brasiliensis TaxID=27835 RepID=A0A0N4XTK7_NIPBR|nr:unnamed protein product [Nippostrongylus brasiliensis]
MLTAVSDNRFSNLAIRLHRPDLRTLLRTSHSGKAVPTSGQRLLTPLVAVITLTAAIVALGCQDVDVFMQPTTICSLSPKGKKTCVSETTEILKINNYHKEACLRLLNNQSLVRELRVTWDGLRLTCGKQSLLFTRDTEQKVMDSKRCSHSGSCVEGKCKDINSSSQLPELAGSNHYPGITYCAESCGGPGCGCFYLSSGCLFYRIYSVPRNEKVFEIFNCEHWQEEVQLTIASIQGDLKTQHQERISLRPTIPKRVGNMRITLSSITIPPTPTLAAKFITDGKNIALWTEEREPTLQCDTHEAARSLNCSVVPNCDCQPAENSVKCSCSDVDITDIFERSVENRFPIRRPWITFVPAKNDKTSVEATIPRSTTAEILIHLKEEFEKTATTVSESICKVENSIAKGCYSCPQGAEAEVSCTTDGANTMATIRCADLYFTIPCDKKGVRSILRFSHDRARVHKQCAASCGTTEKTFEITGILQWTRTIHESALKILAGESQIYEEIVFPDFYHIFDVITRWYKYLALAGGFLLLAVILGYIAVWSCGCKMITAIFRVIFTVLEHEEKKTL